MRRVLFGFTIFMFSVFACVMGAKAATLTANKTTVNVGDSFSLSISNPGSNSGYILSYDSSILSVESNSCGNGSSVMLDKIPCSINFKVKNVRLEQDKTISFSLTDEGQSDVTDSVYVTVKKNVQSSTTTTTQQQTTTTQAPAQKSNDATLRSLEVTTDGGDVVVLSPGFRSNVYEYSATVSGDVSTVNINATMSSDKANMVISNNASEELVEGENNRIIITVTAEDGSRLSYTLNIRKEALAGDASLSSLTIKEVPDFEFDQNKYKYTIKLDKDIEKLTFDYVAVDEDSQVTITGNDNLKDGSKVRILVTAPDGSKKEYTITISKEENKKDKENNNDNVTEEKNPLIIMGLSIVAFGLIGGIIYVARK